MYQSTLALNMLKPLKYGSNATSIKTSKKPIKVSNLKFITQLTERKRIKCPKNGLLLVFNLKDGIDCHFSQNGKEFHLGSFQSIMVTPSQSEYLDIIFPKDSNFHLCLVKVTELNALGNFKDDFAQTSFKSQNDSHCWYTGLPNAKLSSYVYDLINLKSEFSSNKHMLLGYTNLIIGSKLTEFDQYIHAPKKQVDLRNDEIERIHECINYIKENYALQLDVDTLCATAALSPQKLQTGFRELYGNTVTSFIKNFRLQIAEELMRTTELNVSQIVYSIGLTSRSYFSKIFKEKYEISPNEYIRKFKFQVV